MPGGDPRRAGGGTPLSSAGTALDSSSERPAGGQPRPRGVRGRAVPDVFRRGPRVGPASARERAVRPANRAAASAVRAKSVFGRDVEPRDPAAELILRSSVVRRSRHPPRGPRAAARVHRDGPGTRRPAHLPRGGDAAKGKVRASGGDARMRACARFRRDRKRELRGRGRRRVAICMIAGCGAQHAGRAQGIAAPSRATSCGSTRGGSRTGFPRGPTRRAVLADCQRLTPTRSGGTRDALAAARARSSRALARRAALTPCSGPP